MESNKFNVLIEIRLKMTDLCDTDEQTFENYNIYILGNDYIYIYINDISMYLDGRVLLNFSDCYSITIRLAWT